MNTETRNRQPEQNRTTSTLVIMALIIGGIIGWAVFGLLSGKASADPPVVPPGAVEEREDLPTSGPEELVIPSDVSVFDLRFWKPVPPDRAFNSPVSPVNYSNYLRVIKRKAVDRLYAHYATSGLKIDLQCATHSYHVMRKRPKAVHETEKEYAVEIDISKEPLGKSFLVLVQATYWNGFRNASREDAMTYIDKDAAIPDDLSLILLFPQRKPVKDLHLDQTSDEGDTWISYPAQDEAYRDPGGLYAYWGVRSKKAGNHYRLRWNW
jgi:hypothetical protein